MIEKGILIEPLPMTIACCIISFLAIRDWTYWIILCLSTAIATSTLALRRYWRISALGRRMEENLGKMKEWRSRADDAMSYAVDNDHKMSKSISLVNNRQVRILTYNLYLRPPLINSNGNDWKDERLDEFINTVLPNYDIIALQEVFALGSSRQRRLIHAAQHLGYHHVVKSKAPPFITSLKFIDAGLLILSRYPIIDAGSHIYNSGYQIDHYAAKQVIYARIKVTGTTHLNVFTTHTQASYYENTDDVNTLNDHARLTQIQELCEFVKQKVHLVPDNATNPVVILGDLNLDARRSVRDGLLKSPDYGWLEDLFYKQFGSKPSTTLQRVLYEASGHHLEETNNDTCPATTESSSEFQVHDLIMESYNGDHPVTYGDAKEDDTGKLTHIQEPVLTNSADWGCRLAIDYIFLVHHTKSVKVKAVPKSTKVEKFEVEMAKFPFFQLSDHYAIETTLEVL